MPDEASPPGQATALPSGQFAGRAGFRECLSAALVSAPRQNWPELIVSDADFRDWPLGDRAVVDALHAWVRGAQRFTMLARNYDMVVRQHPLFVEWRRMWAHKIECRACKDADPLGIPSALWTPDWTLVRTDALVSRGQYGLDDARRFTLREQLDGWLARSTVGFPAYTLGL